MIKLTCIMCPVGCSLEVEKTPEGYKVSGNSCIRGEKYGIEEVTQPKRVVTTVCKTTTGYVSVKTTAPIDKQRVKDVVAEVGKITLDKPKYGEVVIKNVLGLNADIIVTSGN